MQVGGTVQGASTKRRRGRRLEALLALAATLVIAAAMALVANSAKNGAPYGRSKGWQNTFPR